MKSKKMCKITCHSDYEKLQLNHLLQASRWHDAFCCIDVSQCGMAQIDRQFDNSLSNRILLCKNVSNVSA